MRAARRQHEAKAKGIESEHERAKQAKSCKDVDMGIKPKTRKARDWVDKGWADAIAGERLGCIWAPPNIRRDHGTSELNR